MTQIRLTESISLIEPAMSFNVTSKKEQMIDSYPLKIGKKERIKNAYHLNKNAGIHTSKAPTYDVRVSRFLTGGGAIKSHDL